MTDPRLAMSLAEYQKSIEAAISTTEATTEAFVGVGARDAANKEHRWLFPMSALTEVGLVQQVARLGQMPPGVIGLANFRGQPRTLVDAAALLGTPTEESGQWALILKETDLHVALLWPTVAGIFPLSEFPETKPSDARWVRTLRRDKKGQAWRELDIKALLTHLRTHPLSNEIPHE